MSETIERTWEQELIARGREYGKAEGRAEGRAEGSLQQTRRILEELLEQRFGQVPEAVRQRLHATDDLERLERAVLAVNEINNPGELPL
jgi:predicted transposase YdaD